MLPDPDNAVKWAGLGTGIAGLVGLAIKFMMKTVRTERLDQLSAAVEISTYARLQQEIVRLEDALSKRLTRMRYLETHLSALEQAAADDINDMAEITILLSHLPCGHCSAPDTAYECSQAALDVMKRRKRNAMHNLRGEL